MLILHILEPSVRYLINLTRLGDFPGMPFWCQLATSTGDAWAIVPYLSPTPLNHVPFSINFEEFSEVDSEEWAREHEEYKSETDNLFDATSSIGVLRDEKLRRQTMSLNASMHVGSCTAEETILTSNANANEENV